MEVFKMSSNVNDMSRNTYLSVFHAVSDLGEKLEKIFGDNFAEKISLSSFRSLQVSIDGKEFWISPYVGKGSNGHIGAIFLTAESQDDKEVLEVLKPVISEIMGNVGPICSYDMLTNFVTYEKLDDKFEGKVKEISKTYMCPTIEWNTMDPDSRIRTLVSNPDKNIENLQLFNGKSISDYEEKGQAYKKTRKE